MAENLEETTQKLDAILDGLNDTNLSSEDIAYKFITEYSIELFRIAGHNREYPQSLENEDPQRVAAFNKYAERIPDFFVDEKATKDVVNDCVSMMGYNDGYNRIIADQISNISKECSSEQLRGMIHGFNKATEGRRIDADPSFEKILHSMLENKNLNYMDLHLIANRGTLITSFATFEAVKKKLEQMPEATSSRDQALRKEIERKIATTEVHYQRQNQTTLDSNVSPSPEANSSGPEDNTPPTPSEQDNTINTERGNTDTSDRNPSPEQEDKYEVKAMEEEQAKAMFALGGDALEKMELKDLANLQLAVDKNPNAFTDAQRAQIKELSWKMIENVANRKRKLDPKETKSFRSMLDHVPATTFMESGKELSTFKDAEERWFNTDRGIDDRTFGERVKEQASQAKKHVSEKVAELKSKGKAVHRLNRMKYNRDKAAIKQMFAQAKAKAAEFRKQAAAKIKE